MKLLLVGLDALDYRLFTSGGFHWFDELCSKANHGIARPDHNMAMTGPSWTSILTGLKIETHGVTDLHGRENWKGEGSKSFSSVDRSYIWDYLNEAGLFCGVMNFPVTWPAPEIDGWFVSGWWTELSYTPKVIKGSLDGYISDYLDVAFEKASTRRKVDEEGNVFDWVGVSHSIEDVFQRCLHIAKVRLDVLLRLPPVDCLLVQFPIIDRIGHKTLGLKNRSYCYRKICEITLQTEWLVKILAERYKPEFLAIISDHGWQLDVDKEWAGTLHSEYGTWFIKGPTVAEGKRLDILNYNFLPSLLRALGLPVPEDMDGQPKIILKKDEEIIAERLEGWGYKS